MNQKTGIVLGVVLAVCVIFTLIVYLMSAGALEAVDLISITIIIVIVGAASFVLWDRARNVHHGLPAKDERLITISYRAGYYGFIAAIWTAVGAPVLADILLGHELEGHLVTALVVLAAGLVFMVSYLFLSFRGHHA
jgi:hypothetical protein